MNQFSIHTSFFLLSGRDHLDENPRSDSLNGIHLRIFWYRHEDAALVRVYVNYLLGDFAAIQLRVDEHLIRQVKLAED